MTRQDTFIGLLVATGLALPACTRRVEPERTQPDTLNLTSWTDRTELYMEYQPLVAGRNVRFAVHLTNLGDFRPLMAGRSRIELVPDSGQPTVLTGPEPSRPGAFRVEGAAPAAGRYRWTLSVESPTVSDRHDLGQVSVYAEDNSAASASRPAGDLAAIAYSKEQQWTNEFASELVRDAELRRSIRVPATIEPLRGGEAIVATPAAGRLMAQSLPSVGARVRAGEVLGRLEPRLAAGQDRATLVADVAEAQASLDTARAEQTRAERLLADRAVPARRVEDARRATMVAEARLRAAEARLAQREETLRSGGGAAAGNAFVLRAPIAGRIAEIMATLGASYDEGAPLFRIVRTDRVALAAQVPSTDVMAARRAAAVDFEIPGRGEPLALRPRRVRDSGVINPATRALTLEVEVDNPAEQLLVGEAGTSILYTRDRQRLPAVPRSAVLMEAGRPYVFVQIGGERFVRRPIEVATRDGDLVGIGNGIKAGDRIVTRGAYEIQLASAAKGLPAEGHVH